MQGHTHLLTLYVWDTLSVPQCKHGPFPLQQLDQCDDSGSDDDDDGGGDDDDGGDGDDDGGDGDGDGTDDR